MTQASSLQGLSIATTHSTRPTQQGVGQTTEAVENFEQQLSNQLDQADSTASAENNDNNQMLDDDLVDASADSLVAVESLEELPGEIDDPALTVQVEAPEAIEMAPQVLATGSQTVEPLQSMTNPLDQVLPMAGNNLPPVERSLPIVEQPVLPQMLSSGSAAADQISSQTTASVSVISSASDPAKTSQLQPSGSELLPGSELSARAANFKEGDIIKAGSGKQDANQQMNQSRSGIAMASSLAAAASQLQQVPLSTASANLNLPMSAFPVDSMLNLALNQAAQGISSPVHSQAWSQGLTEQVAWMVRGNIQTAEIKLNPANLGPLEVKLSIEDDVARLSFVSNHAPVREALDAALPRLREMLEQQGITLADVDVSQYSEQGQQSTDEFADNAGISNQTEANSESSDNDENLTGVNLISINDGVSIYA